VQAESQLEVSARVIKNLKEMLQEARQERSSQLLQRIEIYNDLEKKLKQEKTKVAMGLEELAQVQAENLRVKLSQGFFFFFF
jgi:hypothetical protein